MVGFKHLGTKSVWTAHDEKYSELDEKYSDFFPNQTDIFNIAAAIGLKHDEISTIESQEKEFLSNQIDSENALYIIMRAKYPNKDDTKRFKELAKHAEYGITILYEKVTSKGTYNPENF